MTARPRGFLTRWSRRKRAGKQVRGSDAAPAVPEQRVRTQETDRASAATSPLQKDVVARETGPVPHSPPAEPESGTAELPDLPPIESLDKDSDFSLFMKQGVPEKLRRLALRKLWRLTPGVPDGLDDYDEDYSIVGAVAETVSSVSKAGQRMTDEAQEPQAERREKRPGDTPEQGGPDDAFAKKPTQVVKTAPEEPPAGTLEQGRVAPEPQYPDQRGHPRAPPPARSAAQRRLNDSTGCEVRSVVFPCQIKHFVFV